ncbi:hypothetical protein [Maribacter thermophilus]|uniref:hypothetical protein n=1 Tax=Maribacter thermophilus TaxID=1197874 RepID=UPI000640DAF6|nr:hypothetical protein [Maribacter thermophilus]
MKTSEKIVVTIAVAYAVLHLSVLFKLVPHTIVWGGKIASIQTIYVLEMVALVTMLFLAMVILMKNRIIKPIFTSKAIKGILFVFAVFFMLNTLGNLLAETKIEKVQALITLYLAFVLFKTSKHIAPL